MDEKELREIVLQSGHELVVSVVRALAYVADDLGPWTGDELRAYARHMEARNAHSDFRKGEKDVDA